MKTISKKATAILLAISLLFVCSIAVYAYEVDRTSSTVDGYYCNGTLWTISSKSMGASTYVNSGATVSENYVYLRVRCAPTDPVSDSTTSHTSNSVDVIIEIDYDIGSATGTHRLSLATGGSWHGDTYY